MGFFGIGIPELLLIMVIALVVFGPQRLPEIGRSLGKAIRDFREMSSGFTSEWEQLSKELEEAASEVQQGVKGMEAELEGLEREVQQAGEVE